MDIFVVDKLLWHGDKVRAWQQGENAYPVTVEVDLTGACNSHCPRCAGGERRGKLDSETVRGVIDDLAENGARAVIFTGGGEPTLHEDLHTLMAYVRSKDMDCSLITNGVFMSDDQVHAVARYCTWVRVSLDAGGPSGYKHSHGGSEEEFNSVVANIGRLVGAKKSQESKCTIGVGFLVDNDVLDEMIEAAKLCNSLEVDYLQYRPYYIGGWFDGPESINIEKYSYLFETARKLQTDKFNTLHSGPKFDKIASGDIRRGYTVCHGQQFCAVITATGDVALCCVLRGKDKFVLGNIKDTTFKDIWNGERRRYVISNLDVSKDCPPLCRCDGINEMLKVMQGQPTHINFL